MDEHHECGHTEQELVSYIKKQNKVIEEINKKSRYEHVGENMPDWDEPIKQGHIPSV